MQEKKLSSSDVENIRKQNTAHIQTNQQTNHTGSITILTRKRKQTPMINT